MCGTESFWWWPVLRLQGICSTCFFVILETLGFPVCFPLVQIFHIIFRLTSLGWSFRLIGGWLWLGLWAFGLGLWTCAYISEAPSIFSNSVKKGSSLVRSYLSNFAYRLMSSMLPTVWCTLTEFSIVMFLAVPGGLACFFLIFLSVFLTSGVIFSLVDYWT